MGKFVKIMHMEVVMVYAILLLCVFIADTIFVNYLDALSYIVFLKYAVVSVFFLNVFTTHYLQKIHLHHPYIMFLGLLFLFIVGKIFLDIVIPHINFARTSYLSQYVYSNSVQIRMLRSILVSLISLQIGASLAFYKTQKLPNKNVLSTNISWVRVGLLFFYIGLPFLAYQNVMMAKEIMQKGYLAFHTGDITYSNNLIITVFSRFSLVGFFIFFAGIPNRRQMYINLLVFLIFVMTPMLMQGLRGPVMCLLLVLLWYVLFREGIVLKKLYLLVFVIVMVVLNSFIAFMRFDREFEIEDQLLVRFLFRQGISIQVLGYAVQHEDKMADYSVKNMFANLHSFVDNVVGRVTGDNEKLTNNEKAKKYGYIGYWIADIVNPRMLARGSTNGSSYLAEYYLIGRDLGQFIGSLLIGFITVFFVDKGKTSRYGLLFLLFFLPSWLYIPRDNTFDFITDNISNLIFVFIALILIDLMKIYYQKKELKTEKIKTK